ncbi:MAG: hypothetical protein IT353_21695 [Gemmatimonadaceae bacterium]|nr:hypothetical protein [Gemmatimonadaceae bacterium]
MRRPTWPAVAAAVSVLALCSRALHAQDEGALRAAFEGKLVSVKIGMPATARGIDVFPLQTPPVDWREVAKRTKEFGTALKIGDQVMVTKIVVKKNSHIEFQLGGGGWGTLFDSPGTSDVSPTTQPESKLERALRDSIKVAPGGSTKRRLEKDLSDARTQRERANDVARAEAEQANAAREANLRAKRVESGSRFNVRFKDGIPPEQMTPDGVRAALAEWVDFSASGARASVAGGSGAGTSTANAATGGTAMSRVKKGMTVRDVEALLGPATSATDQREGSLTVNKRSYTSDGLRVVTSFINDVLIDFVITPR